MNTLTELLDASLWTKSLSVEQRARVEAETAIKDVPAGAFVCRKGDPVENWIGIVHGLVKMTSVSPGGKTTTFLGVAGGGWFGEGSLLKDLTRKYDIVALRATRLAMMPKPTFDWLMATDFAFNRFLLDAVERTAGAVHRDGREPAAARARRAGGALHRRPLQPVLYPAMGPEVQVSQEEIGYLSGVSRQRVNQALRVLEAAGLLKVVYGGLLILDLEGLRSFGT